MWQNKKLANTLLQCYPTTIWSNGRWSPVTIIKFKDFEVRQVFNANFRNWSPKYHNTNNRIRFTPLTPLFRRNKGASSEQS